MNSNLNKDAIIRTLKQIGVGAAILTAADLASKSIQKTYARFFRKDGDTTGAPNATDTSTRTPRGDDR